MNINVLNLLETGPCETLGPGILAIKSYSVFLPSVRWMVVPVALSLDAPAIKTMFSAIF